MGQRDLYIDELTRLAADPVAGTLEGSCYGATGKLICPREYPA